MARKSLWLEWSQGIRHEPISMGNWEGCNLHKSQVHRVVNLPERQQNGQCLEQYSDLPSWEPADNGFLQQLLPHPGHWGADHGRGMGKESHFMHPVLGGGSWQTFCREIAWSSPSRRDRHHRLMETLPTAPIHTSQTMLTKLKPCLCPTGVCSRT